MSYLLDIISQKNKVQIRRNCKLWGFKGGLWEGHDMKDKTFEYKGLSQMFQKPVGLYFLVKCCIKNLQKWCFSARALFGCSLCWFSASLHPSWERRYLFLKHTTTTNFCTACSHDNMKGSPVSHRAQIDKHPSRLDSQLPINVFLGKKMKSWSPIFTHHI